ncbi:hypothetical protein EYF80_063498 [Liparis tanakae]|uniref:Uncharacterized protein n=1 Tax=Liparis tanakae TaxID=230148 RepID=A0A4Z2ECA7_9TELE|nr:hypothetical protein EYF80_063498 [Liparis tanakae]
MVGVYAAIWSQMPENAASAETQRDRRAASFDFMSGRRRNDVEDGSVEQRLHLDLQGGEPDSTGCRAIYVLLQENRIQLDAAQYTFSCRRTGFNWMQRSVRSPAGEPDSTGCSVLYVLLQENRIQLDAAYCTFSCRRTGFNWMQRTVRSPAGERVPLAVLSACELTVG